MLGVSNRHEPHPLARNVYRDASKRGIWFTARISLRNRLPRQVCWIEDHQSWSLQSKWCTVIRLSLLGNPDWLFAMASFPSNQTDVPFLLDCDRSQQQGVTRKRKGERNSCPCHKPKRLHETERTGLKIRTLAEYQQFYSTSEMSPADFVSLRTLMVKKTLGLQRGRRHIRASKRWFIEKWWQVLNTRKEPTKTGESPVRSLFIQLFLYQSLEDTRVKLQIMARRPKCSTGQF